MTFYADWLDKNSVFLAFSCLFGVRKVRKSAFCLCLKVQSSLKFPAIVASTNIHMLRSSHYGPIIIIIIFPPALSALSELRSGS